MKFCKIIAGEEGKRLLDAYFNLEKLLDYKSSNDGVDFLIFLYQLLPKDIRKNFFLFVKNRVQGYCSQCRLIKNHQSNFFEARTDRIAFILQNKYLDTQ